MNWWKVGSQSFVEQKQESGWSEHWQHFHWLSGASFILMHSFKCAIDPLSLWGFHQPGNMELQSFSAIGGRVDQWQTGEALKVSTRRATRKVGENNSENCFSFTFLLFFSIGVLKIWQTWIMFFSLHHRAQGVYGDCFFSPFIIIHSDPKRNQLKGKPAWKKRRSWLSLKAWNSL